MSIPSINADLGESVGLHSFGNDEELLEVVDTVNVACGMHAGDPTSMARAVEGAVRAGVTVGAHPGLPDLVGFGRREMALTAEEVRDLVRYQVGALTGFLRAAGASLDHIKPHGALYGMTARRPELMDAVCDVAADTGVAVYGLLGTAHEEVARRRGVRFVSELYVDLDYADDGSLVLQRRPLPPSPEQVVRRIHDAVAGGFLTTPSGRRDVRVDSVCVHSDHPGAVEVARTVREALSTADRAVDGS